MTSRKEQSEDDITSPMKDSYKTYTYRQDSGAVEQLDLKVKMKLHHTPEERLRHIIRTRLPSLSWWTLAFYAWTLKWTKWGTDRQLHNLRNNLIQEQQNIGLISALLLRCYVSVLTLANGGEMGSNDFENGTFVVIWSITATLLLFSDVLSVMYLLSFNELGTDEEVQQYANKMGSLLLAPMFQFVLGTFISLLGFAYWFFLTTNLSYAVLCFLFTAVIIAVNVPIYHYMVYAMWTVKETNERMCSNEDTVLTLSAATIRNKLNTYTTQVGFENIDKHTFLQMLEISLDSSKTSGTKQPLSYVTKERANLIFDKFVSSKLAEE